MNRHVSKFLIGFLHQLTPVRIIVIASVAVFFWFVVLGDKGLYQMRRLIAMKNRLVSERQALNDEIDKLSAERQILSDPANLEMAIRSELGYIKPGEVIFEEKK